MQTTLGAELSSILGIPYYSLDTLFWNPGWKTTPTEEFRSKVQTIMRENEEKGWIIDGNYDSKGANVDDYATDIICECSYCMKRTFITQTYARA